MRTQLAFVAALATLGLAGCGASSSSTQTETVHTTTTQTLTRAPSSPVSAYVPPPATPVAPLGRSNAPMPAGETEGTCPYISNDDAAGIEGDHVYRSSILTTTTPQGCRFYFYASPYQAIADIVPTTLATSDAAYSAMIATGGPAAIGVTDLVPGVSAVLYQTAFNPSDGNTDWACAFAKGPVLVVVHTQQTNTSQDARNFAAAIAATI